MRIALVVGNALRDLSGHVLLASYLCNKGATCYLVPGPLRRHEIQALAPDFVLLTSIRVSDESIATEFTDAGIRIGVLDAEGGVMPDFNWYAKQMAPNPEIRRQLTCYCSWGTRLAEYAEQNGWYLRDQICITGAPRFDFYSSPWKSIQLPNAPSHNEYSSPVILLNGSFSVGNPDFKNVPSVAANMLVKNVGYSQDEALAFHHIQRQGMEQLADITNKLADRFPQAQFVYRPHPSERLETYHELLEKRDNIHLIKKGEIQGWLRLASGVIMRGCTTAIEAGMAGVPSFSPMWLPMHKEIETVNQVSVHSSNFRELEKQIESLLDGTLQVPESARKGLDAVISDWFFKADGLAHQRVGDSILASLSNNGQTTDKNVVASLLFSCKSKACQLTKELCMGRGARWA
jgi:surface carbohydrate biosynthesis protein